MSSRLLRHSVRQLRTRSYATPNASTGLPKRAFHASASRQDPVLDAILYLPHEMLTLIHTQVPWYAAIPASAFILRTALVTSLGSWARSLMARYVGLQPLRQALARQKRDEITREGNFRTPKEAILRIKQEVKQEVQRLDSRWNVTLRGQIGWTLLQIPIFFTLAEVIRKMCGAHDGLLALGLSVFKSKKDTHPVGPTDAAVAADVAGATKASWTPDGNPIAEIPEAADMGVTAAVDQHSFFEPSLANEGMLWFQDLTVADPTGALPFVVSGLMFSNIYFTKNTNPNDASMTQKVIRKTLLGVALLVGPFCQNLPAGLMLYWASSTLSVITWNFWLDWKYPAPRQFTACKRPLQMPPVMKLQARRL